MRPISVIALLALVFVVPGFAHTWIEQIRNVDASGKYIGEYGYPRGFKSKTDPGYNSETDMNYLLPPLPQQPPFINSENLVCHPNQRKPVQSADRYPRLEAPAGGFVALRYSENGHVSNPSTAGQLDTGRRPNGGSVFIFGTTEPKEDEKIADVLRWTPDGKGGDKRGVLLAVNDYDDGRCYEINRLTKGRQEKFPNYAKGQYQEGAPGNFPLMCESNAQIPKTAALGKPYTLYWVWQWPKEAGKDPNYPKGKDEYYTTCMDINVVDVLKQSDANALQFGLGQQDAQSLAVKDFRSRKAILTDPLKGELGPVFGEEHGSQSSGPTPTSDPPAVSQQPTSVGAPNTTPAQDQSTITRGPAPTNASSGDFDIVFVTVTELITVTAPVVTVTPTAAPTPDLGTKQKRDDIARHKMRRGRYFRAA